MALTITLSQSHALVGAVALASGIVASWLGVNVGSARKRFGVKYPTMYDDTKPHFNCYQRAHQNYLEGLPTFLTVLTLGSIYYPLAAAGCGAVYLISRISYAFGYYTGDPKNRSRGEFGLLFLVGLLGLSVHSLLKIGDVL